MDKVRRREIMDLTCQSLNIDKIVLNNFRSFLGKHEIVLGYSREKFVNLIIGPNGSGKTTIVEALQWAFNRNDQESSTLGLPILNRQKIKSIKNHQKAEVSVQIFLSDKHSDQKLKIERKCVYIKDRNDLTLASDARKVKELKKSRWVDTDKGISWESIPTFFGNGEQNSAVLIENSFPSLSTGDKIVLWFSQMATTIKSTKCYLPLILDSTFSHLDTMKRIRIAESFKDNFSEGQLILIGSDMEFKPVMDMLKPIINRHHHLVINSG
jgi:recombinational DNA repair ATPase RecF